MPNRVEFVNKSALKNHVILDVLKFRKKAEALAVGLSAVALKYWIDQANARFSSTTSSKYIDSIYFDSSNAESIKISVVKNTLASMLEGGQSGGWDLRKTFLKKSKQGKSGNLYRRIFIPESDTYIGKQNSVLDVSIDGILGLLDSTSATRVRSRVESEVKNFNLSNVPVKSFLDLKSSSSNRGAKGKFVTITNKHALSKPADTWKHPEIKAALISSATADFMRSQRSRFLAKLFEI